MDHARSTTTEHQKGKHLSCAERILIQLRLKTTGPLTKSPKKSAASLPAVLNEYSCPFPHAAFEKSLFLQSGDVAVNSADADLIRCQIFGDLPRAYLLVCMLGKIFQKPLALPCQIFCHPLHLQFAICSQIIILHEISFINMRISRKLSAAIFLTANPAGI